jgi:putative oxygen-independent coproporphyrinogen III oxidase
MAGIYLHIPFCRKICSYCDFYKTPATRFIPEFLENIGKELQERADYLQGEGIETIYLGGGTPTLLRVNQAEQLFSLIQSLFKVSSGCEITMEANPDDLTPEYLQSLHAGTPVNRLSIGIQSFRDHDLDLLNRRHNAVQAVGCVDAARQAGFKNITIDLIYGLPGMEVKDWEANLDLAFSMDIDHLSAYHLTIEPRTAMSGMLERGLIMLPEDSSSSDQFTLLHEIAAYHGFDHYEISNLSKPGFMSEHNCNYWKQKKYLGAGPSAHSYDLESRRWNVSHLKKYIEAVSQGQPYSESENLDLKTRFNEYLMLSLRTSWGLKFSDIRNLFGDFYVKLLENNLKTVAKPGWIIREEDVLKLTPAGWLVSDYIVPQLMAE